MQVVLSRVRVILNGGKPRTITTRTCFCRTCRTLVLEQEPRKLRTPAVRSSSLSSPMVTVSRSLHRSKTLLIVLVLALLASCTTVPITKRRQLDLIPAETMLPLSFTSYQDFISKHTVIRGTPEADMVTRTGVRIQKAVEQYFALNNLADRLKGYAWEFNLVDDKQVNAWAMPGGKVVVYTGILPMTMDENGLAVVLAHEVSHAVAQHGDERMSQGLIAEMGGIALSAAISQKPAETQQLFMTAYGVGTQVGVLLPYSRLQESEADRLGLIFMAMAGYDPRNAVPFWVRMAQSKQGGSPPVLLSTHPADEKRIEELRKLMPEALQYYKS
jgi:predicted Zn-dependent protease